MKDKASSPSYVYCFSSSFILHPSFDTFPFSALS